jgi:hypothetical protein
MKLEPEEEYTAWQTVLTGLAIALIIVALIIAFECGNWR